MSIDIKLAINKHYKLMTNKHFLLILLLFSSRKVFYFLQFQNSQLQNWRNIPCQHSETVFKFKGLYLYQSTFHNIKCIKIHGGIFVTSAAVFIIGIGVQ